MILNRREICVDFQGLPRVLVTEFQKSYQKFLVFGTILKIVGIDSYRTRCDLDHLEIYKTRNAPESDVDVRSKETKNIN
jgi:hypothetical protein